jgi:2-polyprenyl-6-hydroxyphenyl methylase/3-demethylubiquinone-9 3-methyltransferase
MQLGEKIVFVNEGESQPCPICAGAGGYFGALDFAISGNDAFIGARTYPDTGIMVQYFRCGACGLIFTPSFNSFTAEDFKAFIYNDTYLAADPPFVEERPERDSQMIDVLLGNFRNSLRMLDYGGGTGLLARKLRAKGFTDVKSYDPFYQPDTVADSVAPADIVFSFEVVEHIPDQLAMLDDIMPRMKPDGVFIFSTQLQPADIVSQGINWWYIMPRNGHISLHSSASLACLFRKKGLMWRTLTQDLHMAWYDGSRVAGRILSDTVALEKAGTFRNPLPPT